MAACNLVRYLVSRVDKDQDCIFPVSIVARRIRAKPPLVQQWFRDLELQGLLRLKAEFCNEHRVVFRVLACHPQIIGIYTERLSLWIDQHASRKTRDL